MIKRRNCIGKKLSGGKGKCGQKWTHWNLIVKQMILTGHCYSSEVHHHWSLL